jgi:hypothetical protein
MRWQAIAAVLTLLCCVFFSQTPRQYIDRVRETESPKTINVSHENFAEVPVHTNEMSRDEDRRGDVPAGNDSVLMLTEGSKQDSRLPIIPERIGPCRCVPPFSNPGAWQHGEWVPDVSDSTDFVSATQLLESVKGFTAGSQIRILLIGDSIARYLMCFLSKAISQELLVLNGTGCEPEQTRGVLYQLWPPTQELQRLSPIILHFVSDFYFPETFVAYDTMDLFESENPWLPPVRIVVISRGTWDNWIRLPRPQVGRQLLYGYSKGLEFIRIRFPDAAISVYGLSKQYPSRYHRHSERCAMQTSFPQVRALIYCATRSANAALMKRSLAPVQFFDMFLMTWSDTAWHFNTMNNDGMHFIGPHVKWFARYFFRLAALQLGNSSRLEQFTPPPLPPECDQTRVPLNTMPPQKKLKQPKNLWKNPKKERKDCGIWLREKITTLQFTRTLHLDDYETDGTRLAECITYHKSTTQRFGGWDPNWVGPFAKSLALFSPLYNVSQIVRRHASAELWGMFSKQSSNCAALENALTAAGVADLRRSIDNGTWPCSLLVILTLRVTPSLRRELNIPALRDQRCDMLRKGTL